MKSGMIEVSLIGVIINPARFSRNKFGTGYLTIKKKLTADEKYN
jgi:hypothetical protein